MGQHVYGELEAGIASLIPAGSVFEVRLLGQQKKRVDAGYFDSPSLAASALQALDGHYKGIYITPNPVQPELLARSANRITPWATTTTMDPEVTRRRWLLIDCDPKRAIGISSTDAEHEAAVDRAFQIAGMLEFQYGWCTPMVNSSGNGAHVLYPMNEENSPDVRDWIAKFLKCLSARFSDERVVVDTTVFNAARIWRIPGTWARKGDSLTDRPHRKASILQPILHLSTVRLEQVQRFVLEHEYLLPTQDQSKHDLGNDATGSPADDSRYRAVNNHAMRRIKEWVQVFFPDAREYKEGYRVGSAELGRLFEEDLTIHPWPLGIKDFGPADQGDPREGRRTPIGVIAEFVTGGDIDEAARKLADCLSVPLSEFGPLPTLPPNMAQALPGAEVARRLYDFASVKSIADLRRTTFRKQHFVVKGLLPTGNIMLASRPKMRKTWLALQLSLAVASGQKFLNWDCVKGDVLFLGLEDNDRRLRSRIDTLLTFDMQFPDLSGFRYWTGGMSMNQSGKLYVSDPDQHARTYERFPRGEAGVDALYQYKEQFPNTVLFVIDTYAHFRDNSNNRDIYQRDYEQMMPITKFAAATDSLVIPVHHEKKGNAGVETGDFMEDVSGSSGITGGVDGILSIKGRRGVQEENESRKLLLTGRDIEHDVELDMTFDAQRGGWLPAARQDVKVALRALFDRHPYITQVDLSNLLPNVSKARIARCLTEMKFEGELVSTKYGFQKNRA